MTLLTGDTRQSNMAPNTYAHARVLANEASAVVAMNNGSAGNTTTTPVGACLVTARSCRMQFQERHTVSVEGMCK
jgi:hypothetical protein